MLRPPRLALGLLAPCLLAQAACGSHGSEPEPAPEPAAATAPSAPEEEGPGYVEHEVLRGETLWKISKAYDIDIREILEANQMTPRQARRVEAGHVLRIPGATEVRHAVDAPAPEDDEAAVDEHGDEHVHDDGGDEAAGEETVDAEPAVAEAPSGEGEPAAPDEEPEIDLTQGAHHTLLPGETLWDVARLYDVSLSHVLLANELEDGAARAVQPGQRIFVPGIRPGDVRRQAPTTRRGGGIRHELADGETIWTVSRTYHVSVSEILGANRMDADDAARLTPGQRILVPGARRDAAGRAVRPRLSPRQQRAVTRAIRLGLGTRDAARDLLNGTVRPAWIRAAGGRTDRTPGTLRWPITNGWIARGYGSGEGGYHLAVDIMGEIGWNVRASAPGIVGYAGDEIPGYGNMVMVVHSGGWVTMYAHNSVNFAVAGERVDRGTVIAEVGSTGISRGPHVHFEFKHGGMNCDPAALFRPGVRHRDGRLARMTPLEWLIPRRRPGDIPCAPRRRHPRSRWVINE